MNKTTLEQLNNMKTGDRIKLDIWDIWRMPTGWVMAVDSGSNMTSVFVPDILNVEAKMI
jgi:hypothetical protein